MRSLAPVPVTFEDFAHLLRYDAEAGQFYWRDVPGIRRGTRRPHERAGTVTALGYRAIKVNGKSFSEHRLAWLLTHGEWPTLDIDHIDGNSVNNRLANLRLATDSQNLANAKTPSNNTSGFRGVSRHTTTGRWVAHVRVNRRLIHLGLFDTPAEAGAVAQAARVRYFGEFARAA